MKGLYKDKYLIVYYDKDELPLIVSDNATDFSEKYAKYREIKDGHNTFGNLSKIFKGERKSNRIKLVEADTVTDDCFKEEDEDFIRFINENRKKTKKEKANELGITARTYFRRKRLGLIKEGTDDQADN